MKSKVLKLVAIGMSVLLVSGPAPAQDGAKPHRSILELLFGSFRRQPAQQPSDLAPAPKKPKPRKSPSIINIDTTKQKPPAEKLVDARHILVAGDFMAAALGDGLQTTFGDAAGVIVDQKTNSASGLVRKDYYDWLGSLPGLLDTLKPALLVVQLGANDRQKMTVDGVREEFHSDKWTAAYQQRIKDLTDIAVKRHVPIVWVGIPPFQSPSLTADVVTINLMLRQQVEASGGIYVDVWDGFVDGSGKFSATGSDVDGQQARLRSADGVGMTKAGKAKLAFYVEKVARRILGDSIIAPVPGADLNATLPVATTVVPQKATVVVRTEPVSLNDPSFDGSAALSQATTPPADSINPRDLLVAHGDPGKAPTGRIDDFAIPAK
mgnify:CR=1 FL=1